MPGIMHTREPRNTGWLALVSSLVLAICAWSALPAFGAIDIPANQWVRQPTPQEVLLPGFPGSFDARGWNHMVYDSVGRRMWLYDGYLDSTRPYSIYANALWTYDPVTNRLALQTVSNWFFNGANTVEMPENLTTPTPYDRHSYSAVAFIPEKNSWYIWAGANSRLRSSNHHNEYGDTWRFDATTSRWTLVHPGPTPYTVFEQAGVYDPSVRKFIIFGGATSAFGSGSHTWLFDIDANTWSSVRPATSPDSGFTQSLVYDPVRRVTWLFGGGAYGVATNRLWKFDASALTWTQVTPSGQSPAGRRFAMMAYDSTHDVILMWGGLDPNDSPFNETWAFHPATATWSRLTPAASPPSSGGYAQDLAYDPVNDIFVLHLHGSFWLYRYNGAPVQTVPPNNPTNVRVR